MQKVEPLCPQFGVCGGCLYQDRPYAEELRLKEEKVKTLFEPLDLNKEVFEPIVASPLEYHYRHKLDLTFIKIKTGETALGFMPQKMFHVLPIEECVIARKEISDFLPQLKERVREKLPPKYRTANIVTKTDDSGRIVWGGAGKRTLKMAEADYLSTVIGGRRVYYALDTFFQANLSILPLVIEKVLELAGLDARTTFLDLYGGVGLFGIFAAPHAKQVILIEDNPASAKCAAFNFKSNGFSNVQIVPARVEKALERLSEPPAGEKFVALVDPPRNGLAESAVLALAVSAHLERLLYLSCGPESLARDLRIFADHGWKIARVTPFDFFPKTRHIETLVLLTHPVRGTIS